MKAGIELMERGLLPDAVTRIGIRALLRQRLNDEREKSAEAQMEKLRRFVNEIRKSPVAVHTECANEQHYELPADFFLKVLGPRLKYSSCLWPAGVTQLGEAEEAMLRLTCERARIADGQRILELGCGWGSLTLWLAEQYPQAQIMAVSNSQSQREFIEEQCRWRGLANVKIQTADMNAFDTDEKFDRVVSVEMFEHMRNWEELLRRISGWLTADGLLFVHIFTHRELAYLFETDGAANWMGRYFFTGGMMPSDALMLNFPDNLKVDNQWRVGGEHYAKTLEAWLVNMGARKREVMPVMAGVYGEADAGRWFQRWRVFFMACSELFGYRGGQEWFVSHYLLSNR